MKIRALQLSYILPGVAKVGVAVTSAFELAELFERWRPVESEWRDWFFPKSRDRKRKEPVWQPPSFDGWWVEGETSVQHQLVYQTTAMIAEAINRKALRPVGNDYQLAEWGLINSKGKSSRSLLDSMRGRLPALGLYDIRHVSEKPLANREVIGQTERRIIILRKWNYEALTGEMMVAALPITVHLHSDLCVRRMQWIARAPSGAHARNSSARRYLYFDGVHVRRLLSLKDLPDVVRNEFEQSAEALVLNQHRLFAPAHHAVQYVVAGPKANCDETDTSTIAFADSGEELAASVPVYGGLNAVPVLSSVKRLPAQYWEACVDRRNMGWDRNSEFERRLADMEQACDLLICRRTIPGAERLAKARIIQELELGLV